jgi:hypothetical protein
MSKRSTNNSSPIPAKVQRIENPRVFPRLNFGSNTRVVFPSLNFNTRALGGTGVQTRKQKRTQVHSQAINPLQQSDAQPSTSRESAEQQIAAEPDPQEGSSTQHVDDNSSGDLFEKDIIFNTSFPNISFQLGVKKFKRNTRFSVDNVLFKAKPIITTKKVLPLIEMVPAIAQLMIEILQKLKDHYDSSRTTNRQFILTINSAKIDNGINHR